MNRIAPELPLIRQARQACPSAVGELHDAVATHQFFFLLTERASVNSDGFDVASCATREAN